MAVEVTKDQMWFILYRVKKNIEETGHPMHHKVGDGSGIIVDTDPTLEQMIEKLNPLPAIPVNLTRYGFDLYGSSKGGY